MFLLNSMAELEQITDFLSLKSPFSRYPRKAHDSPNGMPDTGKGQLSCIFFQLNGGKIHLFRLKKKKETPHKCSLKWPKFYSIRLKTSR